MIAGRLVAGLGIWIHILNNSFISVQFAKYSGLNKNKCKPEWAVSNHDKYLFHQACYSRAGKEATMNEPLLSVNITKANIGYSLHFAPEEDTESITRARYSPQQQNRGSAPLRRY